MVFSVTHAAAATAAAAVSVFAGAQRQQRHCRERGFVLQRVGPPDSGLTKPRSPEQQVVSGSAATARNAPASESCILQAAIAEDSLVRIEARLKWAYQVRPPATTGISPGCVRLQSRDSCTGVPSSISNDGMIRCSCEAKKLLFASAAATSPTPAAGSAKASPEANPSSSFFAPSPSSHNC